MARSFVLPLWVWVTLIPLAICIFCGFLAYLARFRNPATIDICHYFRGADIKRMLVKALVDEARGVPAPEFMQRRRLMLHEARKFMLAVVHDMGILIVWCNGAIYRELVEKPWEADGEESPDDSAEFAEAHRRLATAAREFRRFALSNLLRINLALLFGTYWRLRWVAPLFSRPGWTDRFLEAFAKVFKEIVETGNLYDDELPQAFLISLFKLEDPATDIALWRQGGLIPH